MNSLYAQILIDKSSSTPIYLQLANTIIRLIREGVLKPGSRLPSIRELAKFLGVHNKTVVAAYEEIAMQDWIISRPRSGVLVSGKLPELKPKRFQTLDKKRIELPNAMVPQPKYKYVINDGFPDYRIAPIDILMKYYKNAFYYHQTEPASMYADIAGSFRLRQALANYLHESRGLQKSYESVLITRGAQMAIFLAASIILKPGDEVIVGEPNYFMANQIFQQLGARLIKVKVDEQGIDVDAIEKIFKRKKPRLLYIIPHHHHPTTVTLSAARRMKLLSLINEHKTYVIEDDYDYDFHYSHSPILPLANADYKGRVLYIGSITKSLTNSIRVGYLIAPDHLIQQAASLKKLIDIHGDLLLEDALSAFIEKGEMQKHIKKSVKLYHYRRDVFCEMLASNFGGLIKFRVPDGGMAIWVEFNKKYPLPLVAEKIAKHGVFMSNGLSYNTDKANYNSLRMGFASLEEMEMRKVLDILKGVL